MPELRFAAAVTGGLMLAGLVVLQQDPVATTYAAFSDTDTVGNSAGAAAWAILDPPPECADMQFKNVILGTQGDDVLVGTKHGDLVIGLGGNDSLIGTDGSPGNNGRDCLVGGPGNDRLEGGNAKDVLVGGSGDDTILGANGPDRLYGGPGTDFCDGGHAPDVIEGCETGPALIDSAPLSDTTIAPITPIASQAEELLTADPPQELTSDAGGAA